MEGFDIGQVDGAAQSGAVVRGSGPACALCGHSRRPGRTLRHFTHGVAIWLCELHGSDAFLTRRGGREFTERIVASWVAVGALTTRRVAAVRAHLRRVRDAPIERSRPGSYSWPRLRRAAEQRFAAGEDPNVVISELRKRYGDGPATVPSLRTMRRWFSEGRWLVTGTPEPSRRSLLRWRPTSYRAIDATLFEMLTFNSVQQIFFHMRAP